PERVGSVRGMGADTTTDEAVTIDLLAEHPELVPTVGEIRWREWGHWPEPTELSFWVDVTGAEAGTDALPVTWVAVNAAGEAVGAVALGEFDIDEVRDRSPWVMGMIVREDLRGRGIGTRLMRRLEDWAVTAGHPTIWVATGGLAVAFYQSCGWEITELVERPYDTATVLRRTP
ncbi:MAG TPA: GNAT family N-acetyltransferase, partial [Micromonosporaceae bacterium]|nr:GNAT family N-acetyltransferase [Micromonosporaceae bacterium]